MTTFSADLAKFLVGLRTENLLLEVVQKARVCLCNAFGMGINGHATPYAPVARAAALALDGEVAGGATLFLDGRRTTIGGACLANSALFHGRAQEDTCGAAHFGTILIPLLTAMIEARGYPLSRLIPRWSRATRRAACSRRRFPARPRPAASALPPSTARSPQARRQRSSWSFRRADGGVARQRGVVRRRLAAILRRRHRRMALPGRRGSAERPGRGRAGARGLGLRAERLRGKIRLRSRLRPDRSRPQSCCFPRPGLGDSARGVPVVPVCAFNQTPVTGALALAREQLRAAPAKVRVRMNLTRPAMPAWMRSGRSVRFPAR